MKAAVDSGLGAESKTVTPVQVTGGRTQLVGASAWSLFAATVLTVAVVGCYSGILRHLIGRWSREPDYSHGFLVPIVSVWLLWQRRQIAAGMWSPVQGRWVGWVLIVAAAMVRACAFYFSFILLEPVALIVTLAGVLAMVGGWKALHWGWPSILFLFFMIPLPGFLANRLGDPLQRIATAGSTYALQTLGVTAVASGNVIWLSRGPIGVVEACSGLRMLVMFGAVTTAAVFLFNRSRMEKVWLVLSSAGIAVVANIFRITATGVAQEMINPQFAHDTFHDLAGWFMMPLAIFLLAIEMWLLTRLFPTVAMEPAIRIERAPKKTFLAPQ